MLSKTMLNFAALDDQWQDIRAMLSAEMILSHTLQVQQIPAPTFAEKKRAEFVAAWFNTIGLAQVSMDELWNVYGWLNPPQHPTTPILMVSAHTDTVFPQETDLTSHQTLGQVYGAGIGDNSLGVAALYLLAKTLAAYQDRLGTCAICFVANSREEGLGNLDGMRAVAETLPNLRAAIVIEGMALGRIYHGGIAVRRLKISTHAQGGHSWSHFGNPSAIHGLVRFAADVTQLTVPEEPRTTYNIGLIEGGHSVNSIATDAHCYLDLRSENTTMLEQLEKEILGLIAHHHTEELRFTVEMVGNRPAGAIPETHPLVETAIQAQTHLGIAPTLAIGSTDANVLLAKGIPTVVVGVTYGANAHRLDEYIEVAPLANGLWQLLLLTVGVAQNLELM